MKKTSNNTIFWAINVFSWGAFYLVQVFTLPLFLKVSPFGRFFLALTFLFWVMVILGLYKFIYTKYNFKTRSLQFNITQIIVSGFVMWGLDLFCRFYINVYLTDFFVPKIDNLYNNEIGRFIQKNNSNSDFEFFYHAMFLNAQLFKLLAYLSWLAVFNFFNYYTALQNLRIEKLRMENLAKDAELARLQSQINPHFLFNGLNSLSSLIKEDAASAEVFVNKFAKVYRYLLQINSVGCSTLKSELQFIESYYYLLKTKYHDGLLLNLLVPEKYMDYYIPSLTLQLLVENVVKHNKILKNIPITITIKITEGGRLIVSNNINLKNSLFSSNGIGLSNISEKYRLLNQPSPIIAKDEEYFSVELSLIKTQLEPDIISKA